MAGNPAEAARLAPADPRVWLGQARLAIRTRAIAEARGWIEQCLTCGVVDAPVWRAALDLALVADDRRLALSAIEHLRASDLLPRRIAALRVAFARLRGDRDAERRALDERLATQPSDVQALERRAELAAVAGDTGLTESLRRRKTEIDATLRDYVNRLEDPTVVARAATLASQAETIGRWFEARAWLLLAAGGTRNPELDARLRSAESAWHAGQSHRRMNLCSPGSDRLPPTRRGPSRRRDRPCRSSNEPRAPGCDSDSRMGRPPSGSCPRP
ncbi:MAG: hypothetical protein U0794_18980 [Isosphaeraceae bacterium]